MGLEDNYKAGRIPCVHIVASLKDEYDRTWGFTFFVKANEAEETMLHTVSVLHRYAFDQIEVKKTEIVFYLAEGQEWTKEGIEAFIADVINENQSYPLSRKPEM